jgi:hypothetical protein
MTEFIVILAMLLGNLTHPPKKVHGVHPHDCIVQQSSDTCS